MHGLRVLKLTAVWPFVLLGNQVKTVVTLFALFASCLLAGWLGSLVPLHDGLPIVSVATGLGLAAVVRMGLRAAVPVGLAALVVAARSDLSPGVSVGLATAQVAGSVVGARLTCLLGADPGSGPETGRCFIAVSAGATTAAVVAAATWFVGGSEAQWLEAAPLWWVSSAVGMALVGATALSVKDALARRAWTTAPGVLANCGVLVVGVGALVAMMGLPPLAFAALAAVPVVFVAVTRDRITAGLLVLALAIVITVAVGHGVGPFADGAGPLDAMGWVAALTVAQRLATRARANQLIQLDEAVRSREALAESEARLRTILNHEPECVKLVDAEMRLLDMNPAGLRYVGAGDLSEVEGCDVRDLLAPGFRDAFEDDVRAVFRGESRKQTFELVALDGTKRWMEQHAAPLRHANGSGEVVAMLAVTRDVTERVRSEEEHLRNQRLDAIGSLTGGIAHDLNNALTPVRLAIEDVRAIPEVSREIVDILEDGVGHAVGMLRQLLTFARGASGEPNAVGMRELVRGVERMLEVTLPKNIRLVTAVESPGLAVMGDRTQLQQVLLNLCINARDAMHEGGTLEVRAEMREVERTGGIGAEDAAPGRYVCVEVIDQGSGLTDEVKAAMFEPFFSTKGPTEGTGLGLPTVLGIVRSHRGFIEVDSTLGSGTRISVHLPPGELDVVTETRPRVKASPLVGAGRTILLVEDERLVARTTRRILKRSGFVVTLAHDGETAIRLLEAGDPPDLLLTDLHMPGRDGLSILHEVHRRWPKLPAVLVTGRADQAVRGAVNQLPHVALLRKPFSSDELSDALTAAGLSASGEREPESSALELVV